MTGVNNDVDDTREITGVQHDMYHDVYHDVR